MKCDCAGLHCPVDATLCLIGGKYKALILWHLVSGVMRHGELQKLIPEATPKMLTQQLRELEGDGLLTRRAYPIVPPKVEYSLTEMGRSLKPILAAMYDWGAGYMKDRGQEISCSMVGDE
jgi:DNA-binding HxlR family transcriptional regulator